MWVPVLVLLIVCGCAVYVIATHDNDRFPPDDFGSADPTAFWSWP